MGPEYAENDWILWAGQERSSLAFCYAIDHSPLTTRRLVRPRGRRGGGGGAGGGLETSRSRPIQRKIFFLPNDTVPYERETSYLRSQMRRDLTSNAETLDWDAFNGCKWVFLRCYAWHPAFPHRHKHMDPIQSQPFCFIYMIVSCLFPLLRLSTCLAQFDSVQIKTLQLHGTEMNTLFKVFHTHSVGLHRRNRSFQWSKRDYLSR